MTICERNRALARPSIRHRTAVRIRTGLPKIYSRELVELFHEQPYCRIANVVKAGLAKRQTASEYLKRLAELGVLEVRVSGREKPFINRELLEVLVGGD